MRPARTVVWVACTFAVSSLLMSFAAQTAAEKGSRGDTAGVQIVSIVAAVIVGVVGCVAVIRNIEPDALGPRGLVWILALLPIPIAVSAQLMHLRGGGTLTSDQYDGWAMCGDFFGLAALLVAWTIGRRSHPGTLIFPLIGSAGAVFILYAWRSSRDDARVGLQAQLDNLTESGSNQSDVFWGALGVYASICVVMIASTWMAWLFEYLVNASRHAASTPHHRIYPNS